MDAVKTGCLIAERRKQLNMTQKELAQKLHVSAQAVSKWERGLSFPDVSLLEPLAQQLDLTVSEVLTGGRDVAPQEELIRDSLRLSISQLGTKAQTWRKFFLLAAVLLLVLSAWLGHSMSKITPSCYRSVKPSSLIGKAHLLNNWQLMLPVALANLSAFTT